MSGLPFVNQVIRASAGSGKTHQLTNRYLGLLARDVAPEAMLATTFTRKAAGEILDRVLERLAGAGADESRAKQLASDIHATQDTTAYFVDLLRGLLRNLHRVRIGTLDSFTISLARSFSLELGLPAGWAICEEADDAALRRAALEQLLTQQPEDVARLFLLLSKGAIRRSVQEQLQGVIGQHHEIYCESRPEAWQRLHVPPGVAAAQWTTALEQLRAFDFSKCGHKGFLTAQKTDIGKFEQEDWAGFLSAGLAAKVAAGDVKYQKKPIPDDAQVLYRTLLQHAISQLVGTLAEQTQATWELLDGFDRELRPLQQSSGALRFHDVTRSLVDSRSGHAWLTETLAFRLDGAIEHLLLDEFQDTSRVQWEVLRPIAQSATGSNGSFFAVGNVKQAIFGWRGGEARIFDSLRNDLAPLSEAQLDVSRRSAEPIIDVVNKVFGHLPEVDLGNKCRAGLDAWASRFEKHTTVKAGVPGYVCLATGPGQEDGQKLAEQRGGHCRHVAGKIRELIERAPAAEIGILCRTNNGVAHMIYELRQLRIEASEEGGNPLADSPAVELLLSLFTLADHPGHTAAWFHLQNSPLKTEVAPFAKAEMLAIHIRRDLLANGYGRVVYDWARRVAPVCDRRDLSRLQQLVDMAYSYQLRSTLRPDDFVRWVRQQRVADPSGARVRVMTVHAAKGLQFDAVVLPELDATLVGRAPPFVVGRDPKSLAVTFVCRYASEEVRALLTSEERLVFDETRQQAVEESLSLLYVAMTRAKQAMYLYIPGPRNRKSGDAWYRLLLQTLSPEAALTENAHLYEHGDPNWMRDQCPLRRLPLLPCRDPSSSAPRNRNAAAGWTMWLRRGARVRPRSRSTTFSSRRKAPAWRPAPSTTPGSPASAGWRTVSQAMKSCETSPKRNASARRPLPGPISIRYWLNSAAG